MTCNKSPEKIKSMFEEIAVYYDKVNNLISFGTHYLIKYLCVKELDIKPRSMVLDLCCGTGDFTKLISKIYPRAKVIGLDFSPEMLKLAKNKNPKGVFLQADCTSIPFSEREFQYATVGFGLRNIEDRQKAISEIYRILETDGIFLHLDFGNHNKLSKIFDWFVSLLCKIFKNSAEHYEYLLNSKEEFPTPDEIITEFEQEGFKFIKRKDFLFGTISAQVMQKKPKELGIDAHLLKHL